MRLLPPILSIAFIVPAITSGASLLLIGIATAYLLRTSMHVKAIVYFAFHQIHLVKRKSGLFEKYDDCKGQRLNLSHAVVFSASTFSLKNLSTSSILMLLSFFLLSLSVTFHDPKPDLSNIYHY